MGNIELTPGHYDLQDQKILDRSKIVDPTVEKELQTFAHKLPSGARVVEVGSGAGVESEILRRAGLHVYSVDLSVRMLQGARKDFSTSPTATAETQNIQADVFKLPFANQSLDAIFCKDLISLGDTQQRIDMLLEFKRIVKPGGKILIMAEELPQSSIVYEGEEQQGKLLELVKKYGPLTNSTIINYIEFTSEMLRVLAETAGLWVTSVRSIKKNENRWLRFGSLVIGELVTSEPAHKKLWRKIRELFL